MYEKYYSWNRHPWLLKIQRTLLKLRRSGDVSVQSPFSQVVVAMLRCKMEDCSNELLNRRSAFCQEHKGVRSCQMDHCSKVAPYN